MKRQLMTDGTNTIHNYNNGDITTNGHHKEKNDNNQDNHKKVDHDTNGYGSDQYQHEKQRTNPCQQGEHNHYCWVVNHITHSQGFYE
jgi:hypothetical protein